MKILHITNNYPTKKYPAFGIFVKEQIESLAKKGIDSDVFFINGRERGKIEYVRSIVKLHHYIKKKSYDVIHCHHCFSGIIYLMSGLFLFNRGVLSYQNSPKNECGQLMYQLNKILFEKIIFKHMEICDSKVEYVPNGVNTDIFRPIDKKYAKKVVGLCEDKRYVLFMDSYNLRRQKRVDRFKKVINILREKYNHSDVEPIVLTNVKRDLVPFYICSSDLHLITSDFEGSPNSVKECMACGIPVVSTPVGDVKSLIGDVPGCFISKAFDSVELGYLANKVLENKKSIDIDIVYKKKLATSQVSTKLLTVYDNILS